MSKPFFITGTDTDVGKTYCSCLLLQAAKKAGLRCLPYKPVAAGCEPIAGQLKNQDALDLMAASQCSLAYSAVNPYALAPAIAPHIAAQQARISLKIETIAQGFHTLKQLPCDLLLVEGAGGWRLPIDLSAPEHPVFLSDWVLSEQLPVIIVVGLKLGCLNHTLLTLEAIKAAGLPVAGWVANQIDPTMSSYHDNLHSLKTLISAPLLAEVPYGQVDPDLFHSAIEIIMTG